ncbi:MAG: Glycosyltransferase, group 2 family protein [uncultured bacterium]|nr:MAG: Glycosyltransferase, group 2 family protein [uncultured bacterium]
MILLIPVYNPESGFKQFITELTVQNFISKIILVNDGSIINTDYFNEVKHEKIIFLEHEINKGKGSALKTGFKYYVENLSEDYTGLITADADGQHLIEDILALGEMFSKNSNELIIGARELKSSIPFRSYFGNSIISFMFGFLYSVKLKDTQTGLRAIPNKLLNELLKINNVGYDFEMIMLCRAIRLGVDIKECQIKTVYLGKNESSHFNPILDSFKIIWAMFKQYFTATSS